MDYSNKKCLVAYYSRKGNNYVSGSIVKLSIGNTEVAATIIQELTGCDKFLIDTINTYPKDYTEATEVAQQELNDNVRPELTDHVEDIASYDVIFLGYPNWWGTMPMAVFTFLEEYDFSGKTIMPFCTHEGIGMGQSESDIKKLCPNAIVQKGLSIRGSNVKGAKNDISYWLRDFFKF